MKHFSADVDSWLLARRNSQLLSALATYWSPPANFLFAVRRFLQFVTYFVGRAAFAAFGLLVALVWKLTLGSGPGWVGLRSKLLIDVAMKISMSQIL